MLPSEIAKESESSQQKALFAYVAIAARFGFDAADMWADGGKLPEITAGSTELAVPALSWLHAIPNGGTRGDSARSRKIHGAALKAEGVRSGVADIFLPYPNARWHGLYIEMKKPSIKPKRKASKGGLSSDQISFKNYVLTVDYGFVVCYSWIEAKTVLRQYIEYEE